MKLLRTFDPLDYADEVTNHGSKGAGALLLFTREAKLKAFD